MSASSQSVPSPQRHSPETYPAWQNHRVRFARFEGGRLKFFHAHTKELKYSAISHVWGPDTQLCNISCLDTAVNASTRKVEFINEKLPGLVGSTPFWMVILTINQADKEERIETIKAIPAVFHAAEKTIAVKENDGIYECCATLAQSLQPGHAMHQLEDHISKDHAGLVCEESYLQRLWTLQEIMLSSTVQFVSLNDKPPPRYQREYTDPHRSQAAAQRIAWSLSYLDVVFRDSVFPAAEILVKAYLSNGTVTWPKLQPGNTEDIFSGHFLNMFRSSLRSTARVRDYFLATMPQFRWYSVLSGANTMTFNELFLDLYDQSSHSGHGFAPKITASMTTERDFSGHPIEAWLPSPHQRVPTCLGDFLKLLGWKETNHQYHLITEATVRQIDADGHYHGDELFSLIESSMRVAKQTWIGSRSCGEVDTQESLPEDWDPADEMGNKQWKGLPTQTTHRCIKLLSFTFNSSRRGNSLTPTALVNRLLNTPIAREEGEALFMITAMVTCGIPLSALEWEKRHFVPVRVQIYEFEFLALLSRHRLQSEDATTSISASRSTKMHVFGRHTNFGRANSYENGPGRDLVLVHPGSEVPAGPLPDFNSPDLESSEGLRRIDVLYQDGLTIYRPIEGSETRRIRHMDFRSAVVRYRSGTSASVVFGGGGFQSMLHGAGRNGVQDPECRRSAYIH